MKLLQMLKMCAVLLLIILSKLSDYNVQAQANDIDFHNLYGDADGSGIRLTGEEDKKNNGSGNAVHSRGKRFIAFPVGSSFSTAVCLTTGVIGNPNSQYLSLGLNWGIAYELPNSTWVLQHANGFGLKDQQEVVEPQIKRRHRRELYGKLEILMNGMGYNGHDCILRALCESRQFFQKTKMGMIGEMLRVVFSLPKQRIFSRELDENADIQKYDRAYRRARSTDDCAERYECSFSLLELAFGKYSSAPDGYYGQH